MEDGRSMNRLGKKKYYTAEQGQEMWIERRAQEKTRLIGNDKEELMCE